MITDFQLLYDGWRGYLLAFFSIVWIANWYMSLFGYLRQSLKVENNRGKDKGRESQRDRKYGLDCL